MTIPLWCLVIAVIEIYLLRGPIVLATLQQQKRYDNDNPRDSQARLEGWARRAQAAHENSFEAFPIFLGGVLIAHLSGALPGIASLLAVAFVAIRPVYAAVYILGIGWLRTALWTLGFAASLGLYLLPALA